MLPAEPKEKKRSAAYCRVSTEKDAQLESLENQKAFFEDFATRSRYELIAIYADDSDKIGLNQQSPYSKGGALI